MSDSLPVVLCGKSQNVATAFKAATEPQYEVIHIILSVEAGVSEIPALLRGERPPSGDAENLGTRNYSRPPVAVITGGGYDSAMVKQMRDACEGEGSVPWLRPDMSDRPPQGPGYGAAMAEKAKACLDGLAKEGTMNAGGVYFY